MDSPDKITLSLLYKLWLGEIETLILLSNQVKTELEYSSEEVSKELIDGPVILLTDTFNPSPEVPVLSNINWSFTLNEDPALTISNLSIGPVDTDSTSIFWSLISFVSTMKSLSAYGSSTLYGNVFLTKSELLKSKDWSISKKLSLVGFDLYLSPIKYGNIGLLLLSSNAW